LHHAVHRNLLAILQDSVIERDAERGIRFPFSFRLHLRHMANEMRAFSDHHVAIGLDVLRSGSFDRIEGVPTLVEG
jgi:hypothetical protein